MSNNKDKEKKENEEPKPLKPGTYTAEYIAYLEDKDRIDPNRLKVSDFASEEEYIKYFSNNTFDCTSQNCAEWAHDGVADIIGLTGYKKEQFQRESGQIGLTGNAWQNYGYITKAGGQALYHKGKTKNFNPSDLRPGDVVGLGSGRITDPRNVLRYDTSGENRPFDGVTNSHTGIVRYVDSNGVPWVSHNNGGKVVTEPLQLNEDGVYSLSNKTWDLETAARPAYTKYRNATIKLDETGTPQAIPYDFEKAGYNPDSYIDFDPKNAKVKYQMQGLPKDMYNKKELDEVIEKHQLIANNDDDLYDKAARVLNKENERYVYDLNKSEDIKRFLTSLNKNKKALMEYFEITEDEFNDFALNAAAITGVESGFGGHPRYKFKEKYVPDIAIRGAKAAGRGEATSREEISRGMAQVKPYSIHPEFLRYFGIDSGRSKEDNFSDPWNQALVSFAHLVDDKRKAVKWAPNNTSIPEEYRNPDFIYPAIYSNPLNVKKGNLTISPEFLEDTRFGPNEFIDNQYLRKVRNYREGFGVKSVADREKQLPIVTLPEAEVTSNPGVPELGIEPILPEAMRKNKPSYYLGGQIPSSKDEASPPARKELKPKDFQYTTDRNAGSIARYFTDPVTGEPFPLVNLPEATVSTERVPYADISNNSRVAGVSQAKPWFEAGNYAMGQRVLNERQADLNRAAGIYEFTGIPGMVRTTDRLENDPASLFSLEGVLDALSFIPTTAIGSRGLKAASTIGKEAAIDAGKFLTTQTPLRNAYKHNPWAFKTNESNWYRQVGQSAIDDALETKLIRERGEEVSPRMWGKFQDQIKRLQGDDAILDYNERYRQQILAGRRPNSPYFAKGELFYPMDKKVTMTKTGKVSRNPAAKGTADYLIETTLPNESFQPAYVKGMSLGIPEEIGSTAILKPNPDLRTIDNFNFYKKDWLRGYKPIDLNNRNIYKAIAPAAVGAGTAAAVTGSEPKQIISPNFRYGGTISYQSGGPTNPSSPMKNKKPSYYLGGQISTAQGVDPFAAEKERAARQQDLIMGILGGGASLLAGPALAGLTGFNKAEMGGDLKTLSGPSHEQGGILVDEMGNPTAPQNAVAEAEGQESVFEGYVFSNSIKNPETGNTFFKDSKKYEPQKGDDSISKKTKQSMLDMLKNKQEAIKMEQMMKDVTKFQKKYGGYLPDGDEVKIGKHTFGAASVYGGMPTYNEGGNLPPGGDPNSVPELLNQLGTAPGNFDFSMLQRNGFPAGAPTAQPETRFDQGPNFFAGIPYNRQFNMAPTSAGEPQRPQPPAMDNYPATMIQRAMTPSPQRMASLPMTNNFGNRELAGPASYQATPSSVRQGDVPDIQDPQVSLLRQILPNLGAAFNIGRGLSNRDYYQAERNPNAQQARNMAAQALDFNVEDLIGAATRSRNRTDYNAKNMATSRGGAINRMTASQSGLDTAMQQILGQAARFKSGVNLQRANQELNLGEQDRQENRFAQDSRLRTDANARNLVGTGLGQIGTNAQLSGNENILAALLGNSYGNFDIIARILGMNNNPDEA